MLSEKHCAVAVHILRVVFTNPRVQCKLTAAEKMLRSDLKVSREYAWGLWDGFSGREYIAPPHEQAARASEDYHDGFNLGLKLAREAKRKALEQRD